MPLTPANVLHERNVPNDRETPEPNRNLAQRSEITKTVLG